MKIKKIMLLLIVFVVALVVFMPKANAGGGMWWDVSIGDIVAYDGMIGNNAWYNNYYFEDEETEEGEKYFESSDYNEYIMEINKYLPKGITLKVNNDGEFHGYDVYIENATSDEAIDFYDGWSGNLYLSGKNNLKNIDLITNNAHTKVNIIGIGVNETHFENFGTTAALTFKNCNISFDSFGLSAIDPITLEGRTKIEMTPNADIYIGWSVYNQDLVKNFIGDKYDLKYEKIDAYNKYYCSPEAIIIKNYEDVELLEQSVEKINAGEGLIFRFDKEIEKFEELYINGNLLTKDVDYTIESGSTIVKLSEEYTKKLAAGNYEVKAMFTDGEGTAKFEVAKVEETVVAEPVTEKTEAKPERTLDKTPKTGYENYNNYYIVLSVVTTIALGIILKSKIK